MRSNEKQQEYIQNHWKTINSNEKQWEKNTRTSNDNLSEKNANNNEKQIKTREHNENQGQAMNKKHQGKAINNIEQQRKSMQNNYKAMKSHERQ